MQISSQSVAQIDRALGKIAAKFPQSDEAALVTDIHLLVSPESGELVAFDDDDNEINRAVIEDWIGYQGEDFYAEAASTLRERIEAMKDCMDSLSILKPYSFVLVDEEKETLEELYIVDDDTIILDDELLKGLDDELDDFLKKLLEE